jgi:hypothetical protein
MNYILGALAVYKVLQIVDLLLPKEAMPWDEAPLAHCLMHGFYLRGS